MGKLQQTDRAGKTAEAWWALLFAEGGLGQTAFRWGWPVIGASVGAWVASATGWISGFGIAGWAATIMLGALGFVWLAVGIDHFRLRRSAGLPSDGEPGISTEQVEQLINAHFLARKADVTKLLDESLREIRRDVRENGNEVRTWVAKLEEETESKVKSVERKWTDWTRQHSERMERRFENVDGGFRSILHRERLAFYAERIETNAKFLLSPRQGKPIADWEAWAELRAQWQSDLDAWLEIADVHRVHTSERVKKVDPSVLEGKWDEDESLPDAKETVVAYRWVAATYDNYRSERLHVDRTVMSAAYARPSMKGNPNTLKGVNL